MSAVSRVVFVVVAFAVVVAGCRVFNAAIPCGTGGECPSDLVCENELCVEDGGGRGRDDDDDDNGGEGEGEGEGEPCGGTFCAAGQTCHDIDEVCVDRSPPDRCVNDGECGQFEECVLFFDDVIGFCTEACDGNASCTVTGCCQRSGRPECFLGRCREPCIDASDCTALGLPACTDFGTTDYCGMTPD